MSDAAETSMAAILARIALDQEETRKFSAEQHKLAAEAGKLTAEANKLIRDRWLAPITTVASIIAAIGASLAAIGTLFRIFGNP